MERFDMIKMTRRDFAKAAGAAGVALGALAATGVQLIEKPKRVKAQAAVMTPNSQGQVPIVGGTLTKYLDPLPVLDITPLPNGTIQTIVTPASQVNIEMREFKANMLPSDFVPAAGTYTGTWVWGYVTAGTDTTITRDTYTGPVVVAARGTPNTFKFTNNLGNANTTNVLAYKWAIDQSLHWANPDGSPMYIPNADPGVPWIGNPAHYLADIPAAVHLHGGEDIAAVDGGPEAWFTSAGRTGKAFYSEGWDGITPQNYSIYTYPNIQEAAPLWFHDHTLGATRLNVYAGLAGAYLLIDPNLQLPPGLTATGVGTDVLVPLVIQDRIFDQNGQLYFPAGPDDPTNPALNPEHQFWAPEFFDGDPNTLAALCVNGKAWPYLNVPNTRQRFFLINGSNSRSYILSFKNAPPPNIPTLAGYQVTNINPVEPTIWQIGTDQGYLDTPVAVDYLRIMPGERAEFIVDFGTAVVGDRLVLHNFGPDAPLSDLTATGFNDPATTGVVMQFRVTAGAPDTGYNPATGPAIRAGAQQIVRLVDPATGTLAAGVTVDKIRALTLNEIAFDTPRTTPVDGTGLVYNWVGGPLEAVVNNSKWNGLRPDPAMPNEHMSPPLLPVNGGQSDGLMNWLTEFPVEGTTEIWEIINTTMDAHPIHTHLAQFQVLNREAYMGMWPDPMAVPPIPVSTGYIAAYEAAFASGAYEPAFGPPLAYTPSTASGGKYGGNPDITPFLTGGVVPPDPNEAGWKDTVFVPPFMVTRFVVRWGPQHFPVTTPAADIHYAFVPNGPVQSQAWPNGMYDYVWHCHIVDHEDNEMMRPDAVYAPPVVTINSAAADPTTFVLSGGGSYRASGAAPWTATVDYGDGTGVNPLALNTNMTFVFSHTYAQHGSYTITVVVTDRLNTSGTATALVAFTDVPVVNAGPDAAINEGDTFVSSGSFTDPDVDLWTATVDYGDGSGVMALALNADKTFALSHKYTDNGVFTVTVVVMDDEGGSGSDTAIVSVGNAGPVVNAGPDKTIPVGGTFASSGSFTDPGSDAWSATVNYGDGSGTMNLDLTDKTFVLSHVYTTAGSFTVTVTVADDDGGVGSDTAVVTVKAPTQVDADFAPKVFNPNAKGTFKMTVFGSSTFDVRNIDQATVRIGPTPFGNVSTRPTKIQIQDTNADGIADLLAFLDRPDSVSAGQTLVSIWGMTKDGFGFFGTTNIKVLSR